MILGRYNRYIRYNRSTCNISEKRLAPGVNCLLKSSLALVTALAAGASSPAAVSLPNDDADNLGALMHQQSLKKQPGRSTSSIG